MILNKLAQGLRSTAEGLEWFESLSEDDQRKALHALVLFCGRLRPWKWCTGSTRSGGLFRLRG
ncbi:DUF5958 family protein [Streptomyces sp900116325]|uniref:DUF5958 family protein n=1 Tax=Streptomyces sp. 900116325 TaxID=3154295 RepID=UPI0033DA13BF